MARPRYRINVHNILNASGSKEQVLNKWAELPDKLRQITIVAMKKLPENVQASKAYQELVVELELFITTVKEYEDYINTLATYLHDYHGENISIQFIQNLSTAHNSCES